MSPSAHKARSPPQGELELYFRPQDADPELTESRENLGYEADLNSSTPLNTDLGQVLKDSLEHTP
jgi:hypothetical protein